MLANPAQAAGIRAAAQIMAQGAEDISSRVAICIACAREFQVQGVEPHVEVLRFARLELERRLGECDAA